MKIEIELDNNELKDIVKQIIYKNVTRMVDKEVEFKLDCFFKTQHIKNLIDANWDITINNAVVSAMKDIPFIKKKVSDMIERRVKNQYAHFFDD